jgi:hypothetical protein
MADGNENELDSTDCSGAAERMGVRGVHEHGKGVTGVSGGADATGSVGVLSEVISIGIGLSNASGCDTGKSIDPIAPQKNTVSRVGCRDMC